MARPSNTEARRTEIIDALQAEMAEVGYARATVQAVAERAELGAGLIHYHFDSKQAILTALVDRMIAHLERRFQRRLQSCTTPLQQLNAFIEAHLALGDDAAPHWIKAWVSVTAEALHQAEVRAVYIRGVQKALLTLERLVGEVLEAENGNPWQAPAMAAALYAHIQGTFQLAVLLPSAVPPGSAVTMAKQMVQSLITADSKDTPTHPTSAEVIEP